MTQHPTYDNPTIREALCEIHFTLPEDIAWDQSLFGKFYQHIQDDFPEMEPVAESAVRLQLQPGRVEFKPGQSRMRYRHSSRNILLQLASGVLTVNVLPMYEGWANMKKDIKQAWIWADEVIKPKDITQIGLRYINFIPKSEPSERPIDWFSPNEYVARAVLDSFPGFFSRVEIRSDNHNRSIVTFGESKREGSHYFVLDIDCIAEGFAPTKIPEHIVEPLHDCAWSIFNSFMSSRLETFS